MRVISCDCFKTIQENLKEHGKNLEISETMLDMEKGMTQVEPLIYFKTGKDGIKKKEYLYFKAKFCPVCGKEIEISDD